MRKRTFIKKQLYTVSVDRAYYTGRIDVNCGSVLVGRIAAEEDSLSFRHSKRNIITIFLKGFNKVLVQDPVPVKDLPLYEMKVSEIPDIKVGESFYIGIKYGLLSPPYYEWLTPTRLIMPAGETTIHFTSTYGYKTQGVGYLYPGAVVGCTGAVSHFKEGVDAIVGEYVGVGTVNFEWYSPNEHKVVKTLSKNVTVVAKTVENKNT